MNPETTITLKITAKDERIIVTAVQTTAGDKQVLEIPAAIGQDTAVVDIPPPPELEAFESLESASLPPVPQIGEESAALETLTLPDLPPVPETPQDEVFD